MTRNSYEHGITPTVRTYFSKRTVSGVIENIAGSKADAVFRWMDEEEIHAEKTLVIGAYLTGAVLANALVKSSEVTVLDIHPEIRILLDPSVYFANKMETAAKGRYDLIIDTTGFGGARPAELHMFTMPDAFLVENPCSEGSDRSLRRINRSTELLKEINAGKKGLLCTGGLNSKTSGTMTLTIEVLRNSMNAAVNREGVLYSAATMEFFERILFREKDPDKFLDKLNKSALAVSSLRDINCDEIIDLNLEKIKSEVITHGSGSH